MTNSRKTQQQQANDGPAFGPASSRASSTAAASQDVTAMPFTGLSQSTFTDGDPAKCSERSRSISQHQLQAFATLVDEVYKTYSNGADVPAVASSPPRRVAFRHQQSAPEPSREVRETPPTQPPFSPPSPARDGGHVPLPPDQVAAAHRRCRWPPKEVKHASGDSGECGSARTHGTELAASRHRSSAAVGCPTKVPPTPRQAAALSTPLRRSSACALWSPHLPPLAALPPLLLPRRWTDGAAAAAAAAASVAAAVVSGPIQPTLSRPPAPEQPTCRLLELPNELLLLITLACVNPGSATAAVGASPFGTSPGRSPGSPPSAPNSPGWSFALIASPQASPTRRQQPRSWATQWAASASRRGSGGGGGFGGGESGDGSGDGGLAGLRAVACAAMTCRRLRGAYRLLLAARPDLELQAEAALRSLHEKRRLVRRLTITQHDAYVARELAAECTAGVAVAAAVALLCGAFGACSIHGGGRLPVAHLTNYVVFTAVHMLLHTAILAAAYRTCAWLGTRRSIALGLICLGAYYLVVVPGVQVLLSLPPVPPHLNLEPWHRPAASPSPLYLPAALLWPLYGDGLHWRLIHLLSNGFAWMYGTYEWHHSFSCVRLRNGLRY